MFIGETMSKSESLSFICSFGKMSKSSAIGLEEKNWRLPTTYEAIEKKDMSEIKKKLVCLQYIPSFANFFCSNSFRALSHLLRYAFSILQQTNFVFKRLL